MTPEEFKRERLKRRHSQDSVAAALGYGKRQVIRWENGECAIPELVAWRLRYAVQDRRKKS